jgi:ribosome biogenesis GTPase
MGDLMQADTGIILSVVAGYYFVEHENQIYLCRGRGKLRRAGTSPLSGDRVLFSISSGEETGVVEKILPRRNQLVRPAVANVDAVVIVIAAKNPEPDFMMLDKLLALVSSLGLEPIICVNKADLDPDKAQSYAQLYNQVGYQTIVCSGETGQGLTELSQLIGGKIVVLAGQSGVGKSHITRSIAVGEMDIPLQIGELSAKLGRGKHTTRQVSLLPLACGGKVADTPGFSVFDLEMESRELRRVFPDFLRYANQCRFSSCRHINEPACAVKEKLELGEIDSGRYDNYLKIHEELKQKEANRY